MSDVAPVRKMLEKYQCRNNDERRNALKEIAQEIALLALSRTGFFSRAAFYGGTALRIFHGLERFSEDLDFSLMEPDPGFDLDTYLPVVKDELASFGFDMDVSRRMKSKDTAVQSAFIKGGTLIHLVNIASIKPPVPGVPENELLKIKLEIDTDPPAGAGYEIKYRLLPIPYSARLYDKPSLFAGKLHALLCRNWKGRVKGRDFVDYVWYLTNEISLNIAHLEARMRQSGHWTSDESLSLEIVFRLLEERFTTVDFIQARADAAPYIRDTRALDAWGADFFVTISRERLKVT